MEVVSLFDGGSCSQIALNELGIKVDRYFASEIEKAAIQVTQKNFPNTIQLGSVTELNKTRLPNTPDLLCGGSPCQDLSIGNIYGKGLEGSRSKLFYDYIRILNEINPKYFFYENVASMKDSDRDTITSYFGVEPIRINSMLYSAQSRDRYYWTNIEGFDSSNKSDIILKDILESSYETEATKSFYIRNNDFHYYRDTNERQQRIFKVGYVINKEGYLMKSQGGRIYSILGKSVTITAIGGGMGGKTGLYKVDDGVRKLTPIECERLQGMPDGYTEGVTNSQRMKISGNGWTVPVIKRFYKMIGTKKSGTNRSIF